MGFLCLLSAVSLLALGLLPFLLEEHAAEAPERPALAALLAFALLIGTNWLLASAGLLTAAALWTCTGLYAGAGTLLLHRQRRRAPLEPEPLRRHPLAILAAVFLSLAVFYMVLRGLILPVGEFDALSYHFPRAVEVLRAHRVPFIPAGDFRVAYFPWNYELLIADALLLTPGDGLVHLIGLCSTFGFGATAFAVLRRAWPATTGLEAFLGTLAVLAAPVLIMHAADFKNDVLFAFFMLNALHWAARWGQEDQPRALVLSLMSLGLAFGTKSNALFLVPVFTGVLVHFRHRFRPAARPAYGRLAAWAFGLLALVVVTGSAWPLLNKLWCGHFLGDVARVGGVDGFQSCTVPRYNGFSNLWRFPLLLLQRPFFLDPQDVYVFWRNEWWWWPRNRSLYSHFGWLCSALLLVVPLGLLRHWREPGPARSFRSFLSIAILGFVACCLPQQYRLDGAFCALPRAILALPVVVVLWTVLPVLAWLRENGWKALHWAAGLGLIAYYIGQAYTYLRNDETKGFAVLLSTLQNPGQGPPYGVYRAFSMMARRGDPVAYDGGFGGFFYPLYGEDFRRPLHHVSHHVQPVPIPAETIWVVIDRNWNVGWSHPGVTTTADFKKPIQRAPSEEDFTLFRQLSADPAWILVFVNPVQNQWLFLRRSSMPAGWRPLTTR